MVTAVVSKRLGKSLNGLAELALLGQLVALDRQTFGLRLQQLTRLHGLRLEITSRVKILLVVVVFIDQLLRPIAAGSAFYVLGDAFFISDVIAVVAKV